MEFRLLSVPPRLSSRALCPGPMAQRAQTSIGVRGRRSEATRSAVPAEEWVPGIKPGMTLNGNWRRPHAVCAIIFAIVSILAPPASAQSPDAGLRGHGGPIRSIAVLDATTVVTGGFDAAIIVWDVPSGTAKQVLRFHHGAVTALAERSFGCFASGGEDGRIAEWCMNAKEPARIPGLVHTGPVSALAFEFVPTTAGIFRLHSGSWDHSVRANESRITGNPENLSKSLLVAEHKAPVNGVAIAYQRNRPSIVSASSDGVVRITDAWSLRLLRQIQLPTALNGLAVFPAPDDRIVLTAADGRVRVLNPDLTSSFEIELPDGPLTAVAVSHDGKTIAVAGMRTPATLIDVATRTVARRILGPGLPIWALAFSLDSRELFTGGADRALRRWTVATGEPVGNPLSPAVDLIGKTDTDPGARVFRACVVCHAIKPEETQRAGPSLHGIMGRRIASAPGYDYSDAFKTMDIVWTPETIAKLFEVGPTLYTPGSKMPEQRLTDPADRQALVDWLARVTKP